MEIERRIIEFPFCSPNSPEGRCSADETCRTEYGWISRMVVLVQHLVEVMESFRVLSLSLFFYSHAKWQPSSVFYWALPRSDFPQLLLAFGLDDDAVLLLLYSAHAALAKFNWTRFQLLAFTFFPPFFTYTTSSSSSCCRAVAFHIFFPFPGQTQLDYDGPVRQRNRHWWSCHQPAARFDHPLQLQYLPCKSI